MTGLRSPSYFSQRAVIASTPRKSAGLPAAAISNSDRTASFRMGEVPEVGDLGARLACQSSSSPRLVSSPMRTPLLPPRAADPAGEGGGVAVAGAAVGGRRHQTANSTRAEPRPANEIVQTSPGLM